MKIEDAIKQKKFESPFHKATVNLIYTSGWLSEQTNTIFKDFELTPQQYNVLRILRGKSPEAICVGDVKEVMLDKSPDLTRLCDRLIKKDLIKREHSEVNRRQVLIRITKEGLELLKQIEPVLKKRSAKLNRITDQEAELLSDLLDKIRG